MLDYSAPFGFLFKDKGWFRKFAIASLLTYTLVGAAPVLGWTIEITRRVAQNEQPVIPELKEWKLYWKLGGKFALVSAVWLLPLLFAVFLLYLPLFLVSSQKEELIVMTFGASLCCVMGFLFVYFIVYTYLFPAMLVELSRGSSAGKAMNPVNLWKLTHNRLLEYLIVFLIIGIALINVVLLVSLFTFFLLLPPLLVYAGLVSAHFAGQFLGSDDRESG